MSGARPLITPAVLAVLERAADRRATTVGTSFPAERATVRGMERVATLQMAGLARVLPGLRLVATAPGRKLLEVCQ